MSRGSGERHVWRFFRAGGFDQVKLDAAEDFVALGAGELDQRLWVALACPVKGLEFDEKTLALIDTDGDGRIRAPEIVAATKWVCRLLKEPTALVKGAAALPLAAIDTSDDEGKRVLASARRILANLGKGDATEITVEDTADTTRIFAQTQFNGDGVIPADAAEDDGTRTVLEEMIAAVGSVPDRSGKPGVDQERIEKFFAEAQAYADWWSKADAEGMLPLGDRTATGHAAIQTVRAKVEDYFARSRLAAFDARALVALNRQESEYLAVAAQDMTITAQEVASFPLALVEAGKPLPLDSGLNPAWAGAVRALREHAVVPLLGDREELTAEDWAEIRSAFAPFEAWMGSKAGSVVEGLGIARVREILEGGARGNIEALLARDKALEPEASAIDAVDKLVRLYRDLHRLLDNFVSFRAFYGRKDKAIFQAGTLFLDQRSCDLVVRVDDPGKHAALAGLAKSYLAYCDCTRPGTGEKMTVAAAFTGGDSDNLMVGRNGIFYDRKGRDWDATITKVVDNPISIRQAFWSPYKRFVRMIEEQVAKRAAAAEAASTAKMQTAATSVATADQQPAAAQPKKVDVGTVAALGVAVGAIGTAIASLATGLMDLSWWQIPLVFVGIILIISLPSVIIAWIKLRQRNLGPILDANGWAVNARAKINIPFGGSLTRVAALPPGAVRDLRDPYQPPKSLFRRLFELILILAVLAGIAYGLWRFGVGEKHWPKWIPARPAPEKAEPAPAPEAPPAAPG